MDKLLSKAIKETPNSSGNGDAIIRAPNIVKTCLLEKVKN